MKQLLLFMIFACTGCSMISHLDEAMALKAYSDEKDAQEKYVQAHDAQFEELLRQLKQPEGFLRYEQRKSFVRQFGEPVLCRQEKSLEQCLYRRIVKPMESPKVYVYFDAQGKLVRWQAQ